MLYAFTAMGRGAARAHAVVVKVLIADDNASVRAVIRSIVAGGGCEVRDCSTGSAAVDEYAAWRPDWVVMDVRMPGIDGIEATRRIIRDFPEARIVVISIHDDVELQAEAVAAGARSFLHKSRLIELRAIAGISLHGSA